MKTVKNTSKKDVGITHLFTFLFAIVIFKVPFTGHASMQEIQALHSGVLTACSLATFIP